ncbi:MAG: VIT1/CCC1 transporter family protein [Candidatus Paceibacterota bacterium]
MMRKDKKTILGHYLSPLVYGANDGIITTFAVISGATGAALTLEVIIILGIANLFADGFSMGVSNYLSMKSQREYEEQRSGEPVMTHQDPAKHGLATFSAFVLAGSLPLVPFLFLNPTGNQQFIVSAIATAAAFYIVGSLRSYILDKPGWRAGLEMLLIGGAAAAIAFSLGWAVDAYLV